MGRLASEEPRKYQIQTLQEMHHQILRLTILGWKPREIALNLNCTEATVGNVIHSELGRRQLRLMKSAADKAAIDVAAEIKRLSEKSIQGIEEMMDDPNTKQDVRSTLFRDMLDRAGHAAPRVIQGQFAHTFLSREDLEEIKQRANEIRAVQLPKAAESVIDLEPLDDLNFKETIQKEKVEVL